MIALAGIRRIGVVAVALLVVLLTDGSGSAQPSATSPTIEPSQLRILYVGHPGSEREKDFVQFLGQHFATVRTADLNAFTGTGFREKDAEGFDVTIFDYDGDGFKAPRPMVSVEFSKPLITVGVAGGLICDRWGLKTGYL